MSIAANLLQIRREIAETARAAARAPGEIRLLAVSKTMPTERVQQAYAAEQRLFGESRVQELAAKAPVLPPDCQWHMIGPVQRNKARAAIRHASLIHTVDSARLLQRLDKICCELDTQQDILLQLNISGESSKRGVSPDQAAGLLEAALGCPRLRCRGLMTMAPYGSAEAALRRVFAGLRESRDRLARDFGVALPELSMGMSSDFTAAIREGATILRLGTIIFGPRQA